MTQASARLTEERLASNTLVKREKHPEQVGGPALNHSINSLVGSTDASTYRLDMEQEPQGEAFEPSLTPPPSPPWWADDEVVSAPAGMRDTVSAWVAHPVFDGAIMVLISLNCVCLAMYNPLKPEDSGLNQVLNDIDMFFTIAFTIELIFKWLGPGPVKYFKDGFNWLDILCVAIGWVGLMPGAGDTGGLSAIRSLRVLRPLRTMSSFPGLRVIAQTILASLPMCGVVLLLAMYLFSIFAIFGVQSFAGVLKNRCVTSASVAIYELSGNLRDLDFDNDEMCSLYTKEKLWKGHFCDDGFECVEVVNPNFGVTSFDNLLSALLLIFQVVTLEGWTPIMYWTVDCTTGWVVIYFLLIVFSGSFYVLNLGLAVVSSSHEASQGEEEALEGAKAAALFFEAAAEPVEEPPREYTGVRGYFRKVVESDDFTNFVTAWILFNTIVLAINYYGASQTYQDVLEMLNTVCTFVFLVEMAMKMIGLGLEYWYDTFNVFDTVVNVTSLAMFLLEIFSDSESISSLSALRAVRILRVMKLMKRAESLQNFIVVLFATVSELGNFCAVVALAILIFALLGMQFFGGSFHLTDNWPEEDIYPRANFDSFGWAMITVFQILTGEDWNSVMYYGIKAQGYGAAIYFIVLLIVGDFIVMNLFIAILLSSFEKHRLKITEKKRREEVEKVHKTLGGADDEPAPEDYETPLASFRESTPSILTPEEQIALSKAELNQVIAAEQSWQPLDNYKLKSMWMFGSDHPVRVAAYALCTNAWFERLVLVLIFVSGLTMTLERPGITDDPNWKEFFNLSNLIFTAAFTMELVVKVTAFGLYGEAGSYLSDSWSILDALVVFVSIILLVVEWTQLDAVPGLSSIRVMRVLRVGRPLRMIQRFPELRVVVQALIGSIKSLGNVIVIATLFWAIFGILGMAFFMGKYNYCTDPNEAISRDTCVGEWVPDPQHPGVTATREWKTHDNNFDNFYNAVTTLFEMSTTEGWVDVMLNGVDAVAEDKNPKRNFNEPMALFFLMFMVFAYFLIVNLFVGIIMDNFAMKRDELKGKIFMTPRQEEWLAAMKASWQQRVSKTPEFRYMWRAKLYAFVESPPFQYFIAACICLNVCVLASFHHGQTEGWTQFQKISDDIFLLIFAIECVLKLVAFTPFEYFKSGWNVFDLTVVLLLSVTFFTGIDFNTSVLRILRITRLLRLVRGLKSFVKLFDMLISSAPTLMNVGGLLFIVFFLYAVAGMQLFGDINRYQENLNASSNFSTFGSSLMILMRMVTGESWNGVMYDCMVQPPNCDSDNNPNHDFGCGGKVSAYLYFNSFTLLGGWIMLNLFLAVVMENYESSGDDDKVIDEYDMEDFKQEWMKIDKKGEGVIRVTSLRPLLMQLPPPMGSRGCSDDSILKLDCALSGKHNELVTFYDVLNAVINHVYRRKADKLPPAVETQLHLAEDKFLGKMRIRSVKAIRSKGLQTSMATLTILALPKQKEEEGEQDQAVRKYAVVTAFVAPAVGMAEGATKAVVNGKEEWRDRIGDIIECELSSIKVAESWGKVPDITSTPRETVGKASKPTSELPFEAPTSATMAATVMIQTVFREALCRHDVQHHLREMIEATEQAVESGMTDVAEACVFWEDAASPPRTREPRAQSSQMYLAPSGSTPSMHADLGFLDAYLTRRRPATVSIAEPLNGEL